jgi:hypothetical protein
MEKVFFENRLREYEEAGFPHLRKQVLTAITLVSSNGPGNIDLEQLRAIWERAEEEFLKLSQEMPPLMKKQKKKKPKSTVFNNEKKEKHIPIEYIKENPQPLAVDVDWDDEDFSLEEVRTTLADMFLKLVLLTCYTLFTDGGFDMQFSNRQNDTINTIIARGRTISDINDDMEEASRQKELRARRMFAIPVTLSIEKQQDDAVEAEAIKLAQERTNNFALSLARRPVSKPRLVIKDKRNAPPEKVMLINNNILLKAFRLSKINSHVQYKIPITPKVQKRLQRLELGLE